MKRTYVMPLLVLTLICVIAAASLALMETATRPIITAAAAEREALMMREIIPDAADFEPILLEDFAEIRSHYYFRFLAVDRPGVLSRISGILAEKNISICTVIQKGQMPQGAVPIVMKTYEARECDVREALQIIDRLDLVLDKTMLIRIEDNDL
jgi:predicted amino acid-binding ACT domain protein